MSPIGNDVDPARLGLAPAHIDELANQRTGRHAFYYPDRYYYTVYSGVFSGKMTAGEIFFRLSAFSGNYSDMRRIFFVARAFAQVPGGAYFEVRAHGM
jgi:hypothetical protein